MSRLFETPTPRANSSSRSLWESRFTNRAPSPIRTSTPSRESSRYPRDDREDGNESGEVVTLLKELQEQVRSLQQQQRESSTATAAARKVAIPKILQSEVHHLVKELADRLDNPREWDCTKQFCHADNKAVTTEVVTNLTNENHSASLVKKATAIYFKTKHRQAVAAGKNTLASAQKKQRKRQRKHNKLRKRIAACNSSTTLTSEEKSGLQCVLKVDYMSTKESATDSGSEREEEATGRVFMRRPLQWRSEHLQSYIDSLDRKAARRQSQRAKEMVVRRSDGAPSLRCPPPLCPESNCFNRLNLDMFF